MMGKVHFFFELGILSSDARRLTRGALLVSDDVGQKMRTDGNGSDGVCEDVEQKGK